MTLKKTGDRTLTVGIDASWMDVDTPFGGVYQYTHMLVKALVEHGGINVVALTGPLARGVFDDLKEKPNFNEIELESSYDFPAIVRQEKLDVIHCPIQSLYNVTFSVPMISTLHDLQHCRFPEFFSAEELESRRVYYTASAELAERVIVSYEHVKDDIVKFYGISPDKIDVCPVGRITPPDVDDKLFPAVQKKYGLPERYLFYAANTWPHKNHMGLLRALKLVRDSGIDITLVCTGHKENFFLEIEALIKELGLEGSVIFTGYVSDEEKSLMLKNATLVVIPTLYEAGSFPLMEAIEYRVPVICSNVTSLPATIGDARFTFDPSDIGAMSTLIAKMLIDDNLQEANRLNSDKARGNAGWDRAVAGFINTYKKAVEGFERDKARSLMTARTSAYERLAGKVFERNLNAGLAGKEAALQKMHELLLKNDSALKEGHKSLLEKEAALQEITTSLVDKEAALQAKHEDVLSLQNALIEKEAALQMKHVGVIRLQNELVEKEAALQKVHKALAKKESGLQEKHAETAVLLKKLTDAELKAALIGDAAAVKNAENKRLRDMISKTGESLS